MRAWRVHQFGPPDAMVLERIARPEPARDEVLVKVHAAGVGRWDALIRAGEGSDPPPLPLTPGSDLSGEIRAVGPGVADLAVGDQVYGDTNPDFVGAYAEYAVARADMIARKPATLTHIEAASVPVVAVTAWQALFDHAQLTAGQTVLVHGAAGNVGAYAVQLACRAGVRVIATAGRDDLAFVRELGADTVVDYRTERFEDATREVDAVLDLVGGAVQVRSFHVLRRGGKLISVVSQPDPCLATRYGVDVKYFLVDVSRDCLATIGDLIDRGALRLQVGVVLPLADAREAHLMVEGTHRAPRGKIVLSLQCADEHHRR
jgi:NADPH:quinone reductase-like Zn-dependent oxidoreductase